MLHEFQGYDPVIRCYIPYNVTTTWPSSITFPGRHVPRGASCRWPWGTTRFCTQGSVPEGPRSKGWEEPQLPPRRGAMGPHSSREGWTPPHWIGSRKALDRSFKYQIALEVEGSERAIGVDFLSHCSRS